MNEKTQQDGNQEELDRPGMIGMVVGFMVNASKATIQKVPIYLEDFTIVEMGRVFPAKSGAIFGAVLSGGQSLIHGIPRVVNGEITKKELAREVLTDTGWGAAEGAAATVAAASGYSTAMFIGTAVLGTATLIPTAAALAVGLGAGIAGAGAVDFVRTSLFDNPNEDSATPAEPAAAQ